MVLVALLHNSSVFGLFSDMTDFFLRVFGSIIISLLSLVLGYRIDIAGRHWLLTDSIHRSKTKYLEAIWKHTKHIQSYY